MGDQEDEVANSETRSKILALQSENSRKREWLDRLKEKKHALEDELKARSLDKDTLEESIARESRKQNENSMNRHTDAGLQDEAVSKFIETEVRTLLANRIPAFQVQEEGDESDDDDPADEGEVEDDKAKKQHESVIVTYLASNPQEREKLDEYRVTYRVDKETTGTMLHEDACEFWGCSKSEFSLCMVSDKGELAQLSAAQNALPVCDESILSPMKRANLFLCHDKVLKDRRDLLKTTSLDIEEVIKRQTHSEVDDSAVTSMKHGGKAKEQQDEEHFAVAFVKWPGIHNLLKMKGAGVESPNKNWHRINFRDICVYVLLALLSGVTILARFQVDYYWLRNGALETLASGIPHETSYPAAPVWNVKDVKEFDDIWHWMRGSFHYQVFNSNSTLQAFYRPLGIIRVRQQKAKVRDKCRRQEVPLEARGSACHYVQIEEDTQAKEMLIITANNWIDVSQDQSDSGRQDSPNPLYWTAAPPSSAHLTGYAQARYDGSGYAVDYNLTNPNAGATFLQDMEVFRQRWLTQHTRLLSVEVMLANYNMGGFVSSTILFEISSSGGVRPQVHLLPMNLGESIGGGATVLLLDILRGVLVFYILIVQAIYEAKHFASIGSSGLKYIFSFCGLIDMSTVATYTAMTFMRLKHDPPNPEGMTQFYSYSVEAIVHERLFTTEGVFFLLVCVRFVTFMKLSTYIDQYWKMVGMSAKMISYWLLIFIPMFIGTVMFAHCIWSPFVMGFSTWGETVISLVFMIKQDFNLEAMFMANPTWTIPFVVYYYILMSLFLMNGFLAITVHAYFQVQLLESKPKESKPWSKDQWIDWVLPGPLYRIVCGKAPGSSKREEREGGGEEDEEEGDSDDDDGKDE